jgi:hypothetical protein
MKLWTRDKFHQFHYLHIFYINNIDEQNLLVFLNNFLLV